MWKREPLTEHEVTELLNAAEDRSLAHNFTCQTLIWTGMRAGEFSQMTEDWVDWQDEQVRVPSQQGEWSPKSKYGARTIPIREPSCLRVMRDYFKYNEAVDVSRQSIYKRVNVVANDTAITKKVTPHVLRHTYGTMIARRGATAQYIRQTMGHADLSSANPYIEFTGAELSDEADKLF